MTEIHRQVTVKLNLGNYESAEIVVGYREDVESRSLAEAEKEMVQRIREQLTEEVGRFSKINAPLKDGQSVIDFWPDMEEK